MIASGMVRKIDLLGRLVIPIEIRKSLKIESGDDVEMYIENDSIILRKYHTIDNYTELAKRYCNTIYDILHINCFVCNKEKIIAGTFNYGNGRISDALVQIISSGKNVLLSDENTISLIHGESKTKYKSQCISPVMCMGDSYGAIVGLNNKTDFTSKEKELIYNAAIFLCGQIL